MHRFALLLFSFVFAQAAAAEQGPNAIQKKMFFRSFVQDHPDCAVRVENGAITWDARVSAAPAAHCPDAFAWVALLTAIRDEFWNWGTDQTTWPATPRPLCAPGLTTACCDPDTPPTTEAEAAFCPANRADLRPIPALPAKADMPSHNLLHHGAVNIATLDPGRALRDLEAEIVWRNAPMIDYIFRHNLYNSEGLAARHNAISKAIEAGRFGEAHRLEVSFPVEAMMIKSSFVRQDIMLALDLIEEIPGQAVPNNPDYPYLTAYLQEETGDFAYYYLISMTNASKNIPNWHWYAIEHVANRGRCDYVGCNDSFGFAVPGTAQPGADFGSHFIAPKFMSAGDRAEGNDSLFDKGTFYDPAETGEEMTAALAGLMAALGIGVAASDPDPKAFSAADPAWRNYRLKGTQTEFVTATGIETGTGSTVVEGGFVNTSSCLTCHAQAGVDGRAFPFTNGVGETFKANLLGFGEVVRGAPKPEWFYTPNPAITVMPTDFVWGTLNAHCVNPVPDAPRWVCRDYPADLPLEVGR